MLKVAVDLNVNQLFDSHQYSSTEIFKQISARFPSKDASQIKLKYDALRRNFTADKVIKGKSGESGQIPTIYDVEMGLLWANRKKFTVPQDHGLDVSLMHINPKIINDVISDDDTSNAASEDFGASKAGPSKLTQPPPKKRKKNSDNGMEEFRAEQRKIMAELERMHREAEDESNRRCRLFLNELKAIRETISAVSSQEYKQYQSPVIESAPTPSPSVNDNSEDFTYEILCEPVYLDDDKYLIENKNSIVPQ